MNRYEILCRLGDGSFGEVMKAKSLKTNGEIVAIKKMKTFFPTWEECLQLRELKSLKVLRHENIIQLKEVIRDKEELYFVFEYMKSSLFKLIHESFTNGKHLQENQIRSIMYQLFSGLAHMHKHGFFHRDIKPENLLVQDEILKIADLGQAREIRSRPPFTDYVSTRWYRSPELLLRSTMYNSPIDMWACGCIMAELFLQSPLFPGTSEADQMCRICKVLGTPTKENWPEGINMVNQMVQFKFPKCAAVHLTSVIPTASKAALQLISELLVYDPSRRLTASQALQHRYFEQGVPRPILITTEANSISSQSQSQSQPFSYQSSSQYQQAQVKETYQSYSPYNVPPIASLKADYKQNLVFNKESMNTKSVAASSSIAASNSSGERGDLTSRWRKQFTKCSIDGTDDNTTSYNVTTYHQENVHTKQPLSSRSAMPYKSHRHRHDDDNEDDDSGTYSYNHSPRRERADSKRGSRRSSPLKASRAKTPTSSSGSRRHHKHLQHPEAMDSNYDKEDFESSPSPSGSRRTHGNMLQDLLDEFLV
jgi:serine/threonine protein kinase